jgi:hypothetical protein
VGLLDDEVAARHLLLERSIDQRDVASLPAASTALARDGSPRRAANRRGGLSGTHGVQFIRARGQAESVPYLGKDVDPAQTPRGKIPQIIVTAIQCINPVRMVIRSFELSLCFAKLNRPHIAKSISHWQFSLVHPAPACARSSLWGRRVVSRAAAVAPSPHFNA